MKDKKILLTWAAIRNDPYVFDKSGVKTLGTTLSLLFDSQSEYKGQIDEAVIFYRNYPESPLEERKIVEELKKEIESLSNGSVKVSTEAWKGKDPTDHTEIYNFLKEEIPTLRKKHPEREFLIHLSAGTPSMHAVWLLMAETGIIKRPFTLVQSYRKNERREGRLSTPVNIDIDTYFKAYLGSKTRLDIEEQSFIFEPEKFKSDKLKKLFEEAQRHAKTNFPILILGERGSGKTRLANWIRTNSQYRNPDIDDDWPAVACGQFSSELFRAELFGYKKGAFTGAEKDKEGLIKKANGDSLFLDEISDISKENQRILIKAIEEKKFYPLGSDKPERSSFRLITATNKTQKELKELLDPDFYDRISVLPLTFPPLREIREDLEWIWEGMFKNAQKQSGTQIDEAVLARVNKERIVDILREDPLRGNLRDVYKIACRLISKLVGDPSTISIERAEEEALQSLKEDREEICFSRLVAKAFAENTPLSSLIGEKEYIRTKVINGDFNDYLAKQIQEIAKNRKIKLAEIHKICDISSKTLSNWKKRGENGE